MSVKNINLLQNENFEEKEKANYIQALANLGQRIGIKGDSITYDSFSFLSCFEKNINITNIDQYLGFIRYNNKSNNMYDKSCTFGIIKKDENGAPIETYPDLTSTNVYDQFTLDNNIFNTHLLENELQFDVQVNNIKSYNDKSIIKEKDGYLYTLLFGNIIGIDEYDKDFSVEIIYNKFKIDSNELVYGLRLFHFSGYPNTENKPVYCLLEIDNTTNDDHAILRVYKYDTNIIGDTYISNKVLDNFASYFNSDNYDNDILSDGNIIRLLNNLEISDIDDITSKDTIFGMILEKNDYTGVRKFEVGNIRLNYSNEESNQFVYDENDYNSIATTFRVDKNGITLIDRINFINNDIIYVYPKLLNEYNLYFTKNINILHQKLFLSIFDLLVSKNSEEAIEKVNYNNNKYIMFVPLDQSLYYFRNSNNAFTIYNVNNVYINSINIDFFLRSDEYNEKIFNNICFSYNKSSINKTLSVGINAIYNESFGKLLNNVNASVEYTLPYIDPLTHLWYINENNTGITSTDDQYSNQYIIFILSNVNNDSNANAGTILNNLPNKFSDINLKFEKFNIKPYSLVGNQINILDGNIPETLECYTALPEVLENNSFLFYNSIVVSIAPGENITNYNVLGNSNDLTFASIWKFDKDNNKFVVINFGMSLYRNQSKTNYIYDYLGILLTKRAYHNNISNTNNLFLLYPENSNDNVSNNLLLSLKIVNNILDISKNELYLPNGKTIKELKNYSSSNTDNKFLILSNNAKDSRIERNQYSNDSQSILSSSMMNTYEQVSVSDDLLNSSSILNESSDSSSESIRTSNVNITQGTIDNNYDYQFNINVPTINNGEVLMMNNNFLNRINVLTLDKENNSNIIYNTIIGSELDINNKATFVIRSSEENTNLGTQTLISEDDRKKFRKQNKFKIEFDDIEFSCNSFDVHSFYDSKEYISNNIISKKKTISLVGTSSIDLKNLDNLNNIQEVGNKLYDDSDIYKIYSVSNNSNQSNIYQSITQFNDDVYFKFNLNYYLSVNDLYDNTEAKKLFGALKLYDNHIKMNVCNNDGDDLPIFIGIENKNDTYNVYIYIKNKYVNTMLEADESFGYLYKANFDLEIVYIENSNDENNYKYIFNFK